MNYELCKQLKDAGFPVKTRENHLALGNWIEYIEPTLSELIKQCDTEFSIHCYPTKDELNPIPWYVIERKNIMDMERCPSPEESVAKLWLELNNMSDQQATELERNMWGGRGKG